MLFKTIENYIRVEKNKYDYLLSRRKERFLLLIEYGAPKEILTIEIDLLRQSFQYYLWCKIKKRIYRAVRLISLSYIFSFNASKKLKGFN
jgi:hypothetical protein